MSAFESYEVVSPFCESFHNTSLLFFWYGCCTTLASEHSCSTMRIQWHQIIPWQLKMLFVPLLASLIIQKNDLQCPERCYFVVLGNTDSELMKIQPFTIYPGSPWWGESIPAPGTCSLCLQPLSRALNSSHSNKPVLFRRRDKRFSNRASNFAFSES